MTRHTVIIQRQCGLEKKKEEKVLLVANCYHTPFSQIRDTCQQYSWNKFWFFGYIILIYPYSMLQMLISKTQFNQTIAYGQ